MEKIAFNDDWKFSEVFDEAMIHDGYEGSDMQTVRIPHTVKVTPYHYFDEHCYQMVSGYCKEFTVPEQWKGKVVLLKVDGAAHDLTVYCNGIIAGNHHCGYTAYTVDLTGKLKFGEKNRLVFKLDSRESLNVPPFGFVVDYMTYGGIYREVSLEIHEPDFIEDVFITTRLAEPQPEKREESRQGEDKPDSLQEYLVSPRSEIHAQVTVSGQTVEEEAMCELRLSLRKKGTGEYRELGCKEIKDDVTELVFSTGKAELWDVDHPVLYECKTELLRDHKVTDEKVTVFGYRKAVFRKNGFYLNGRKVKIRGLNRHQSYPYVGYAMPKSMQIMDADILKNELGVNAVRTSHYPQSRHFIDRCDELGLLVFTEFPGWQHIGDETWKRQAVDNVREMIVQYRNHPSIILWGVRINESVDDDEFYARTNRAAHELDPSRQTGGVRCYKKGSFLEDVFTYNDFSHSGRNAGCEKKQAVTSDRNRPYLISEYNGHMFPTKAFDWEEKRLEHALRHAQVLQDVAGQEDIAGCFGWCMFDYNTHKDFGSGDRICYHGVMDMFRNPKLAAAVYGAQQERTPVLEISSGMDIGEHPGGNRGEVYLFTNADSVRFYINDEFIREFGGESSPYGNLKHGPILVDDYIGDFLETKEHMPHNQAQDVKKLLNQVAAVGLYGMTKGMYLTALKLMLQYHMKMQDAVELYNRYIGNWGGESTVYRFDAVKDGKVIKSVKKMPMTRMELKVTTDHTNLREEETYDVAAVRIAATDEYGNILPFANEPLKLEVTGPVEIIGPDVVSFAGGMTGTYIRTTGKTGEAVLTIRCRDMAYPVHFKVES